MSWGENLGSVTHITTNLKPEDIAQYYGEYIADRCWEMFNFIEFKGASLRSKHSNQ